MMFAVGPSRSVVTVGYYRLVAGREAKRVRVLTRLILSLVATASLTSAQVPQSTIGQIAARAKGRVGVVAVEFETNKVIASYNADDHLPMQSVYKLPICMAVRKKVEAGRTTLKPKGGTTKNNYIGTGGH